MLQIHTLPLGSYQTNCYIIRDDRADTCCVIDPGYDAEEIMAQLQKLGLSPEAILLTHGHFDHVGAVRELAAETGCKVYIHPDEQMMPAAFTAGPLCFTDTYQEGDTIRLAGLTIRVLHTPGHTPGSVCLAVENTLFSGDTLFRGSCGRTDLPGGSWRTIIGSLRRLKELTGSLTVYPGHGESTDLDYEKRYNPYMR